MATREIAIKMTLDGGQTVSEAKKIDDSLQNVNKSVQDINQSTNQLPTAEEKFQSLNKQIENGELNAQQLRRAIKEYQTIAIQAGRTSPIGQEALNKAADLDNLLTDLDQEVKRLANDGRSLQAAMQLGGGVVAGFTAFKGITAALGVENEKLMQTMVQLQGAQSALMGIERLRATFLEKESFVLLEAQRLKTKALTMAQKAYTLVVGQSTGAMKVFKLALAASGIGLLITGLVLLIENWESFVGWVSDSVEKLKEFSQVVSDFFGGSVIESNEAIKKQVELGKKMDEIHKNQLKNAKERQKIHDQRMNALEDERSEMEKNLEEIKKRGDVQKEIDDLEILKAKAKGASEKELFELRKEQNEARLEQVKAEIEASNEIIRINHQIAEAEYNRFKQFLETSAITQGWTEDMIKRDLKRLEEKKAEFLDQEQAQIESNQRAIDNIEAQNQIFLNEWKEKTRSTVEDIENIVEDMEWIDIDNVDKSFDIIHEEIEDLKESWDDMDEMVEGFEIIPEEELETSIGRLREFFAEVKALRETGSEDIRENVMKELEAIGQVAGEALNTLSKFNEFANQIGDNRLKEIEKRKNKELRVEGLTAEQKFKIELKAAQEADKIAKRIFIRNKALGIVSATMDTASAVVKALASAPPPLNFVTAGLVGAAGAAQIATIASQKFEGSSGNVTPPSFTAEIPSGSGSGSSSGGGGDQDGATNQDVTTDVNQLLSVSIEEIDSVHNKVKEIDNISTF